MMQKDKYLHRLKTAKTTYLKFKKGHLAVKVLTTYNII